MENFKPVDFENNLQYEMGFTKRRFLKCGADDKGRGQRIQKRENLKIIEMLMKQKDSESVSLDDVNEPSVDRQFPSESEMHHEENMECLKKKIDCLRNENYKQNSMIFRFILLKIKKKP